MMFEATHRISLPTAIGLTLATFGAAAAEYRLADDQMDRVTAGVVAAECEHVFRGACEF